MAITPVATNQKASSGEKVPLGYYIAPFSETPPADTEFTRLGFKRGFEASTSYSKLDITGDLSPAKRREYLSSWVDETLSFDVVSRGDATAEQTAFWNHCKKPGAVTDNEPVVWLWYAHPVLNVKVVQCVTIDSISDSMGYDAELTWSVEASANGEPHITDITPP